MIRLLRTVLSLILVSLRRRKEGRRDAMLWI